jgi:hypothetical protein
VSKKGCRPSWSAQEWEQWFISRVCDKLTAVLGCAECEWGYYVSGECKDRGYPKRCEEWKLCFDMGMGAVGPDWWGRAEKEWRAGKWRVVGKPYSVESDVERVERTSVLTLERKVVN